MEKEETSSSRQAALRLTSGDAVVFVRSRRAGHYRLTLRRDGTAVATIPHRGSERRARLFLEENRGWLQRARARLLAVAREPEQWFVGMELLFRGTAETLIAAPGGRHVRLGREVFKVGTTSGDLRAALEAHFRRLARIELPARTWELAQRAGSPLRRVAVRNQRSRWGSCSAHGSVSLNWRLIRAPAEVRDYIIWHELMHLKEMNHSHRFWALVEEVCPDYPRWEAWLKDNAGRVGM